MNVPLEYAGAIDAYYKEKFGSFIVKTTRYSKTYISESERVVLSDRAFGKSFLGLIAALKSDVKKRSIAKCFERPKFFDAEHSERRERKPLYIYDKNAAYVNAALEIGVISDKMHSKLMKAKKPLRLAALGSLGTVRFVEVFENKVRVETFHETDEHCRNAWTTITVHVGKIMSAEFCRFSALAFWFDALYSLRELRVDSSYKSKLVEAVLVSDSQGLRIVLNRKNHLFIPRNNFPK